jgi:TRAP-type C4-dicarboxylate transport system permease small subunit
MSDVTKTREGGNPSGSSPPALGFGATLAERIAISICAVTLFVVMTVGAADIISGELFGTFLPFKVDMSGTLAAAAIFLAWPVVQRRRDHIGVDLFQPYLPRGVRVFGWWLSQAMGLLVFGLIAYGAAQLAIDSVQIWEVSAATLGYPIWPAKVACALGAALTIVVFLLQALKGPKKDIPIK